MPKKMKLDLNGLKVNSFVTSLGNNDSKKIKGGVTWTEKVSCSCAGDCHTVRMMTCDSCDTELVCCGYSGTNCEACPGETISPDECPTVAC